MVKRSGVSDHPDVMVSSTYSDLAEHREAVIEALLRLGFFPIAMEFDSAKAGKDVIDSSLEMVRRAQAYVGIVSHRYGAVPKDTLRNPRRLSITELEYHEALSRSIPVFMFLMSDRHPVDPVTGVEMVSANRKNLKALKDDARSRAICAEFRSVEELKSLVIQSLAELKEGLLTAFGGRLSAVDQLAGKREMEIPPPPHLFAVPDFISGHEFVGRRTEFSRLDDWAASDEPVMTIEAIGGAGKSALAWHWLNERAVTVRPDLAGAMWYSFYEGGADMSDFAAYALAYITGQPFKKLRGMKTGVLARSLVAALREQPFLLVLDGLERILVAYHRLDASQVRDDQLSSARPARGCTKPSDGDLLRQFTAANRSKALTPEPESQPGSSSAQLSGINRSKVLITTRLMPAALTNTSGQPIPRGRHLYLGGLDPNDAVKMIRKTGVRGDNFAIRNYLKENFDCHPLLVGIVAGLVNDYVRDPGNFDRWADDPQGGGGLNLSKLDLIQRRTHILAAALRGLKPGVSNLLSRIAALPAAVPFEAVEALNPLGPPPPGDPSQRRATQVPRDRASEATGQAMAALVSALQELERRGLLQWDRKKNSYDLHPVVRSYAFEALEQNERGEICDKIVDYFQSRPSDRYADAKTLADVQQSISIFRALVQADRFDEAVSFYKGDFSDALLFSVGSCHQVLALLKPLFPGGFQQLPSIGASNAYLLNNAAIALLEVGRSSEAAKAFATVLQQEFLESDPIAADAVLHNLATSYFDDGRIASSFAVLGLVLELAEVVEDPEAIAIAHLHMMSACTLTGLFEQARTSYHAFQQLPSPTTRVVYRPGRVEAELCRLRFYQGGLTERQLHDAEAIAQAGEKKTMRTLAQLRGELALQGGDAMQSIAAFERAVEIAQSIGAPTGKLEGRLALARARAGDVDQARDLCDGLRNSAQRPHVELAEVYLEIRDCYRARYHALQGYTWAWADGLPYSWWWELGRCRTVLSALGEPPPNLLAFDRAAVPRVPCEGEVRRLIGRVKNGR